jgi:hypothetical protein
MLDYSVVGRLARNKHTSSLGSLGSLGPFESYEKIKFSEYILRGHFHNTLFSSYLTNKSIKLECYITSGWKGLSRKKH